MADTKTSDLTALSATEISLANDVFPVADISASQTKKITAASLFTAFSNQTYEKVYMSRQGAGATGAVSASSYMQPIFDAFNTSGNPLHLIVDRDIANDARLVLPKSKVIIESLPGRLWQRSTSFVGPMLITRSPSRAAHDASTADTIRVIGGIFDQLGFTAGSPNIDHHIAAGGETGTWSTIFAFYGIRNLVLEGVHLTNPRTFALHVANFYNVLCEDIQVTNAGVINQDAMHFNGAPTTAGSQKAIVRNCLLESGDDAVSFCADDMPPAASTNPLDPTYNVAGNTGVGQLTLGPYVGNGPISDVSISDITLNATPYGIRALSAGSRFERLSIKGIKGTVTNYGVVADNFPDYVGAGSPGYGGVGNFGDVSIDDVDVQLRDYDSDFTNNSLGMLNFAGKFDSLSLSNVRENKTAANRSLIYTRTNTDMGIVNLSRISSYDNQAGASSRKVIDLQGTIDIVNICGASWYRGGETPVLPMVNVGGSVGHLNFTAYAGPADLFADVYGGGAITTTSGDAYGSGGGTTPDTIGTGLLAQWKFEESTGANALDATGNGNTLTQVNSPTSVTGRIDQGFHFTRTSSQYVEAADASDFAASGEFAFSIWVKRDSDPSGVMRIGGKWNDVGAGKAEYLLAYNNTAGSENTYSVYISPTGASSGGVSTDPLASNAFNDAGAIGDWTWLYFDYDGTGVVRLSVNNGTLITVNSAIYVGSISNFRIGVDGGGASHFDGTADDARFYSARRSPAIRTEIYNAGLGTHAPNA